MERMRGERTRDSVVSVISVIWMMERMRGERMRDSVVGVVGVVWVRVRVRVRREWMGRERMRDGVVSVIGIVIICLIVSLVVIRRDDGVICDIDVDNVGGICNVNCVASVIVNDGVVHLGNIGGCHS
jgi:hypothetical protein